MRPDDRAIFDDLLADAVAASTVTREQTDVAVGLLDDLAGSGVDWVQDLQVTLQRTGLAKELADYRRRHRKDTRTKAGTKVSAPTYGGVRSVATGTVEHRQMSFRDMSEADVEGWIEDRRTSRDTISREIQWANDVLGIMRDRRYDVAGPAIDDLHSLGETA